MSIISGLENLNGTGVSVALGNFDGLHVGHAAVLRSAVVHAGGAEPAVLMFRDHPQRLLSGKMPPRLMTESLRSQELRRLGIKRELYMDFPAVRAMSPQAFFEELLCGRLQVKAVSCGYNYRFGADGAGDTDTLRALCAAHGVPLYVADCARYAGEPVSSSRIRRAVADGKVDDAYRMLGRPFSYDFKVVSGDQRGRLLGFPTINQFFPEDYAVPKFGVYAARAWVHGRYYPAVANIGVRPTIGTDSMRSETCILGFSGDLYGKNVEVGLLQYLRPEQKFSGLDALSAQMTQDSERSRGIFDAFFGPAHGKSGEGPAVCEKNLYFFTVL